jgi:hypothetical protein
MALMSPQAVSNVITPTFSAPTLSDTVTPDQGLLLYVKIGGTVTTVTVVVPGNAPYSGAPKPDLQAAAITNTERVFNLSNSELIDPATGLINITYSQVTGVTAALIKH